jgi:hypothetical protein
VILLTLAYLLCFGAIVGAALAVSAVARSARVALLDGCANQQNSARRSYCEVAPNQIRARYGMKY